MMKERIVFVDPSKALACVTGCFLLQCSLFAQQPLKLGAKAPWWKHAVFYEIYPRSFADSNNDGIGDLNGITSKLGYLESLGVDAIWISPCYPSPQKDFGYDVSDYESIDPMYGDLKDFDNLHAAAQRAHLRIIMDYVPNHSSDQHKWFLDSKSSKASAHRDWYIWRDGKPGGGPPNNWISDFGGSAWTYESSTRQYYYHYFEAAQPDLNWRNPAVKKAMFDVTRFWYQHGVAGFRMDAVDTLFEDPQLRDNPLLTITNEFGDREMVNKYNDKLAENHSILRQLRTIADRNGAVLIGETWTDSIGELKEYYGAKDDEIQLPMDFMFTTVNQLSASKFRAQIALQESAKEWPVYVMTNHDMQRSYDRYGNGKDNDRIAKVMAGMYLTLRGTPIMYYGEELGMENNDPRRKEDVKDPLGQSGWPSNKGRDGERTPMQWDDTENAGFTKGVPWLPLPASYRTHNVVQELQDPDSVLMFYKKLLKLRRESPALLDGEYTALNTQDPNVLAYLRQDKTSATQETILILLNMSANHQNVRLDMSGYGIHALKRETLLTSLAKAPSDDAQQAVQMEPYSVYIARISR
jgi:alpha-glucosidase